MSCSAKHVMPNRRTGRVSCASHFLEGSRKLAKSLRPSRQHGRTQSGSRACDNAIVKTSRQVSQLLVFELTRCTRESAQYAVSFALPSDLHSKTVNDIRLPRAVLAPYIGEFSSVQFIVARARSARSQQAFLSLCTRSKRRWARITMQSLALTKARTMQRSRKVHYPWSASNALDQTTRTPCCPCRDVRTCVVHLHVANSKLCLQRTESWP